MPSPSRALGPARPAAFFVAALLGLAACAVLSLAVGARSVPPRQVVEALLGQDVGRDALVVTGLRVPRTAIGLAAGAALGVAGVLAQAVTRNPLASPATLGINAGAGFAVVAAIYALGLTRPGQYVWFAFAGAALAALATQQLARGAGDLDPLRLALSGTVIQLVLLSWTSALMLLAHRTLDEARFWLAGSLAERPLDTLLPALPTLALGLLLALALTPALNALALGDEAARALGAPVARIRAAATLAVVLLAGSAVAVVGPLGFIGLAAPHLVRAVVGPDHRLVVPGALLAGPILLLGADVAGRVLARPSEIAAGIISAFLGAPLLALLARRVAR